MDLVHPGSPGTEHDLRLATDSAVVEAVVSETGASPRVLRVNGVDLVEAYQAGAVPPMAAGVVLVPWPNRVDSAVWALHGAEQQLEVTEPALGHAIHGLLSRARYAVTARGAGHVTLSADIEPTAGYPFRLATSVTYDLTPDGMHVGHRIRNDSDEAAPVALGTHPYLRIGDVPAAELTVTLPAARSFDLDERNIPVGSSDVTGTELDLRGGVRVGEAVPHASFGELDVVDGVITHSLRAEDGRILELVADPDFAYVHFYVTEDFPGERGRTTAVAIEPMTAPPNALRSGVGLHWLEPGATWAPGWALRLRPGLPERETAGPAEAVDAPPTES